MILSETRGSIAFLGRTRHLSRFVKRFFPPVTTRSTAHPQGFSHSHGAQRGAMFDKRGQIRLLIVGNSVLPATKYDADPFKGQCPHGCMMGIAFTTLLLVVNSCPFRLDDGMTRPFMKALPQKLWAGPTEMYPLLFPAAFCHRGDPAERLDL